MSRPYQPPEPKPVNHPGQRTHTYQNPTATTAGSECRDYSSMDFKDPLLTVSKLPTLCNDSTNQYVYTYCMNTNILGALRLHFRDPLQNLPAWDELLDF